MNTEFDLNCRFGRYRARKAGLPVPKKKPGPRPPSFDSLVAKSEGCWLWMGKKNRDGYGIYVGRCASRIAYENAFGPLPPGAVVRHSCDTPACCNPAHLLSGTHAENMADKISRDRQAKGEQVGSAKLSEADVLSIRARHRFRVVTYDDLAREYAVSENLIHKIVSRRLWKHI